MPISPGTPRSPFARGRVNPGGLEIAIRDQDPPMGNKCRAVPAVCRSEELGFLSRGHGPHRGRGEPRSIVVLIKDILGFLPCFTGSKMEAHYGHEFNGLFRQVSPFPNPAKEVNQSELP